MLHSTQYTQHTNTIHITRVYWWVNFTHKVRHLKWHSWLFLDWSRSISFCRCVLFQPTLVLFFPWFVWILSGGLMNNIKAIMNTIIVIISLLILWVISVVFLFWPFHLRKLSFLHVLHLNMGWEDGGTGIQHAKLVGCFKFYHSARNSMWFIPSNGSDVSTVTQTYTYSPIYIIQCSIKYIRTCILQLMTKEAHQPLFGCCHSMPTWIFKALSHSYIDISARRAYTLCAYRPTDGN